MENCTFLHNDSTVEQQSQSWDGKEFYELCQSLPASIPESLRRVSDECILDGTPYIACQPSDVVTLFTDKSRRNKDFLPDYDLTKTTIIISLGETNPTNIYDFDKDHSAHA